MPHANVFLDRDIVLAAQNAKLRRLEAHKELQPCSRLPPTPLIGVAEGSALDPLQADEAERHPRGLAQPRQEQGGRLPAPRSNLCCFEEVHL